jgi:hypothetical protein
MHLGEADRPLLVMRDEKGWTRLNLGFVNPDFKPDPDYDNWALAFHIFGSDKTVAGIGVGNMLAGKNEGYLNVSGKSVR